MFHQPSRFCFGFLYLLFLFFSFSSVSCVYLIVVQVIIQFFHFHPFSSLSYHYKSTILLSCVPFVFSFRRRSERPPHAQEISVGRVAWNPLTHFDRPSPASNRAVHSMPYSRPARITHRVSRAIPRGHTAGAGAGTEEERDGMRRLE